MYPSLARSLLVKAFVPMIISCATIFAATVSGQITITDCSNWREGRQICVQATVSRDGSITSEVTTQSKNLALGCRGGAVAVGSDEAGNALWTAALKGKPSCSASDPFCPNFEKHNEVVQVNAKAAQSTSRIHLFYDFDEGDLHDRLREVG
jgi:hypothetical protein